MVKIMEMTKLLNKFCNRETITYLISGVLTTIAGLGVFWLCVRAGLNVAVSNTVSTAVAVTFAYLLHKVVVFRSLSWAAKTLAKEVAAFLSGRFAVYVMETLLLVLLVDMMNLPSFICKIFTSILVVLSNYVISKKAVFTN